MNITLMIGEFKGVEDTTKTMWLHYPERIGYKAGFNHFVFGLTVAKDANLDIAIYTESSIIVSFIGQLIEEGKLHSSDVNVFLSTSLNGEPEVTQHYFSADGVLTGGWPYGCMEIDTTDYIKRF